jgi:hypothetical protein
MHCACLRQSVVLVGSNYEYCGGGNESRAFVKQESRCILDCKGTDDGPLEIILPKELCWYHEYIANYFFHDADSFLSKKIRNRFSLPHISYMELLENN